MRINKAIVGLFIGLLTPLLGFVMVSFILGKGMSFSAFLQHILVAFVYVKYVA